MGKLVLVLILVAAGYYWFSHRQDQAVIGEIENPVYAEARDPVGVRPGDKVVVESSTRAILAVTWLVYMLPVVFFLLGYFLSAGLTEGWRYAVAIVAAAVSFIPIKLYDGYARKRDTLTYTIVREF